MLLGPGTGVGGSSRRARPRQNTIRGRFGGLRHWAGQAQRGPGLAVLFFVALGRFVQYGGRHNIMADGAQVIDLSLYRSRRQAAKAAAAKAEAPSGPVWAGLWLWTPCWMLPLMMVPQTSSPPALVHVARNS